MVQSHLQRKVECFLVQSTSLKEQPRRPSAGLREELVLKKSEPSIHGTYLPFLDLTKPGLLYAIFTDD
jgi:hypothetical protein